MKTATVTEAKAHLSQLLALVQTGESVLILSRGKPVARIEPVREGQTTPTPLRVEHLVRRGIVRRPALSVDLDRLAASGAPVSEEQGLLGALLSDREEGR